MPLARRRLVSRRARRRDAACSPPRTTRLARRSRNRGSSRAIAASCRAAQARPLAVAVLGRRSARAHARRPWMLDGCSSTCGGPATAATRLDRHRPGAPQRRPPIRDAPSRRERRPLADRPDRALDARLGSGVPSPSCARGGTATARAIHLIRPVTTGRFRALCHFATSPAECRRSASGSTRPSPAGGTARRSRSSR